MLLRFRNRWKSADWVLVNVTSVKYISIGLQHNTNIQTYTKCIKHFWILMFLNKLFQLYRFIGFSRYLCCKIKRMWYVMYVIWDILKGDNVSCYMMCKLLTESRNCCYTYAWTEVFSKVELVIRSYRSPRVFPLHSVIMGVIVTPGHKPTTRTFVSS